MRETRALGGWSLAEADDETGPVLIRMRTELPGEELRARLSVLVRVIWPLAEPTPEEAELDAMVAMENAVFAALNRDGGAVGVAVLTSQTAREWMFYAEEAEAFVRQFSTALTGHPVYPVELHAGDDPAWSAFLGLVPGGPLH